MAREATRERVAVSDEGWGAGADEVCTADGQAGSEEGGGTDGALLGPMNPWLSIYYMVTGRNAAGDLVNPEETLSRLEALRLYTMGSAWVTSEDEELGSIEVGKRADLVVLTDDYLSIPEDQIRKLRSVLTLVDGRVVYSSPPFGELLPN